jgi:hypothetical protein
MLEVTIRSHPRGGRSLNCKTGRRVGYVDLAGDVLNVERDESKCADRAGYCKCAGTETHRGERAIKSNLQYRWMALYERISRHSPDSRPIEYDFAFPEALRQKKFDRNRPVGRQNDRVPLTAREFAGFLSSRRTLSSWSLDASGLGEDGKGQRIPGVAVGFIGHGRTAKGPFSSGAVSHGLLRRECAGSFRLRRGYGRSGGR